MMFHLLSGKVPFLAKTCKKRDWLAVLAQPPDWSHLDHCSFQVRQLCKAMLTYNDQKRPSAAECLGFDWFKDGSGQNDQPLPEDALNSLCQFHERSDLEKVVRMQVASQLSAKKLPKLNAIFKKYDQDNSGTLSMDELALALQELGVEPSTCQRAARALDLDQSGEVEYTEFVAGCLNFFDDNLDHMLWQAFQRFDTDGSGSLSVDEISELLSKGSEMGLGTLSPDANQVKAMIAKLDSNADGEVDWDEFRRFFTPKLE